MTKSKKKLDELIKKSNISQRLFFPRSSRKVKTTLYELSSGKLVEPTSIHHPSGLDIITVSDQELVTGHDGLHDYIQTYLNLDESSISLGLDDLKYLLFGSETNNSDSIEIMAMTNAAQSGPTYSNCYILGSGKCLRGNEERLWNFPVQYCRVDPKELFK